MQQSQDLEILDNSDQCPICLSVFYKPTALKQCRHVFCQSCLNELTIEYEHKKCPLCRHPFNHEDKQLLKGKQQQLEAKYPNMMKSRIQNIKQTKFYRVEVGNTTQNIQTESSNKYRWTLYVKPGPGEDQLSKVVDKVEVKLHPTFNPSTITFAGNQQIVLKRVGWGTFRIDIKIFWRKQYGGFVEVFHDLSFQPKVSKVVTCKLGIIN